MNEDLNAQLEGTGAPGPEFWEEDLEMGLEYILPSARQAGFMDDWLDKRTGRQLRILCRTLGLSGEGSVRALREILRVRLDEFLPYFLVEQFSKWKSKVAVAEFAEGVLPERVLDVCRIGEEDYDKTALLFAIYRRKPMNLRLLFHLDKIHKTGFARMVLKRSRRQPKHPLRDVLKKGILRRILVAFDKAKADGRSSELTEVVHRDGQHLVFIRRAERQDLILRKGDVVHGYRPEWIILDFEDVAKRVNISSVSISVPLEIANRIASEYFEDSCEYENESEVTYAKQIERFLKELQTPREGDLVLVELVVRNSPLEGSPKIKITDPDSNPIATAVGHFEAAIGSLLTEQEHIESVKVLYRKKRVSLIFEKLDDAEDEYVVRYSDHRLNGRERRPFEEHMREVHGIQVLSTEKRFKKQS